MDTSLIQGVALLETQDGRKTIKGPKGEDSNNLFNIKDFSGKGGFVAHDKAEGSRDAYRTYGSREESIQDFVSLVERKYPEAYKALQTGDAAGFAKGLKAGGYATDPQYETKLLSTIERARKQGNTSPQATRAVQDSVLKGEGALGQLTELRRNGWGDDIDAALENGWKPEDIVKRIAGADVAEAQAVKQRRDEKGFISNLGEGAANAVSDMALGARQIIASPDQEQALRDEALARQGDLERRSLSNTVGGAVGNVGVKALPAIAAAAATGGTSVVPMIAGQAAAGAVSGALEPTTEEGQRAGNIVRDAALAGGGAGAIGVLGKGLSKTAAKVVPRASAERQALADAARAEGLPVNAATLTDTGKNIAAALPENMSIKAMRGQADDVLSAKVAEGLGLKGYAGAIDTDMLNAARPAIKQALDDATNVSVTLPTTIKADLDALLSSASNPLTKGIAGDTVVRQAAANLIKAADDGVAVSGRQLQDLASELKGIAQNFSASATERQTAGQMVGKVNKLLTDAMTPDQAAAFREANKQYANFKAVEKMVAGSNDTGVVSPRQMLQAVKTGRFKTAFLKDEAPFQELATTASELLGPANGRGLGDIIGKSVGTGNRVLGAATILEPTTGLPMLAGKKLAELVAGKLVTSENPTIVRLLTGIDGGAKGVDPVVKKYIAKALGAGAGAATVN